MLEPKILCVQGENRELLVWIFLHYLKGHWTFSYFCNSHLKYIWHRRFSIQELNEQCPEVIMKKKSSSTSMNYLFIQAYTTWIFSNSTQICEGAKQPAVVDHRLFFIQPCQQKSSPCVFVCLSVSECVYSCVCLILCLSGCESNSLQSTNSPRDRFGFFYKLCLYFESTWTPLPHLR